MKLFTHVNMEALVFFSSLIVVTLPLLFLTFKVPIATAADNILISFLFYPHA